MKYNHPSQKNKKGQRKPVVKELFYILFPAKPILPLSYKISFSFQKKMEEKKMGQMENRKIMPLSYHRWPLMR
jgi:hypothetical protein